jgi:hypothetical protein
MAYGYNQTPVGFGAAGNARNRIAQALMRVQNPPPALRVPGLRRADSPDCHRRACHRRRGCPVRCLAPCLQQRPAYLAFRLNQVG